MPFAGMQHAQNEDCQVVASIDEGLGNLDSREACARRATSSFPARLQNYLRYVRTISIRSSAASSEDFVLRGI